MLLALLDLAVAERSIALDARIPDSRPCKERKSGAPTVLVMPARSRARDTRHFSCSLQRANWKPKQPNCHWAGPPHKPLGLGTSTEQRSGVSTRPDTAMDYPTACPCPCHCYPPHSEDPSAAAKLSLAHQPSAVETRK